MYNKRYFFVFQNKTYEAEQSGGYLWAPKSNSSGKRVFHWELMKQVQEGDIVFHSVNKKIVAISIATSNCYSAKQPGELKREDLWEDDGWRVDSKYILIKNPIVTSDYKDEILNLQPKKYAPFNQLGRGNTGYLFESNLQMSQFLFSLLCKANPYLENWVEEFGF